MAKRNTLIVLAPTFSMCALSSRYPVDDRYVCIIEVTFTPSTSGFTYQDTWDSLHRISKLADTDKVPYRPNTYNEDLQITFDCEDAEQIEKLLSGSYVAKAIDEEYFLSSQRKYSHGKTDNRLK